MKLPNQMKDGLLMRVAIKDHFFEPLGSSFTLGFWESAHGSIE